MLYGPLSLSLSLSLSRDNNYGIKVKLNTWNPGDKKYSANHYSQGPELQCLLT